MTLLRRVVLLAGLGSVVNLTLVMGRNRLHSNAVASGSPPGKTLSPPPVATATATVLIRGFQFIPPEVTIKQGGSVTFTNMDSTPHTATPRDGAQFMGTGRIKKGESQVVQFEAVGIQDYFCDIHPSMIGRVIVK